MVALLLVVFGTGLYLTINKIFRSEKALQDITDDNVIIVKPQLDYKLIGCDKGDRSSKSRVDISTVSDGRLHFTQKLVTYCNANEDNLKLYLEIYGDELLVKEVFNADMVTKCVCPIGISGDISGLKEGIKYKLRFVFENKYSGEKKLIKEKNL